MPFLTVSLAVSNKLLLSFILKVPAINLNKDSGFLLLLIKEFFKSDIVESANKSIASFWVIFFSLIIFWISSGCSFKILGTVFFLKNSLAPATFAGSNS